MLSTANLRRAPAAAGTAPPLVPGGNDDGHAAHAVHAAFLGLPFSMWTQAEVIEAITAHRGAPYRYVVTPNASHVVAAHREPDRLMPIYRGAWLSLCDSRIVRALARLDRLALPLVTGSDLVATLLAALNAHERPGAPRRILIVGPPRRTEAALRARYPNLTFDVLPAPAALARSAESRLAVARACMSRHWQLALLCVGSPAQEMIAVTLAELGCQSGVALCVGASIDFLTGAQTRAPRWLQRLSLEWAYRLACEPRRLWRRYLVESPRILRLFIASRSRRGR